MRQFLHSYRPFQDEDRRECWAATIFPNNVFESLSIRMYLHEIHQVVDGRELLRPHYNVHNCPLPGSSGCLVTYQDVFLGEIGCWATVVITATSRKSISDCIHRTDTIGKAADEILRRYDSLPRAQQVVCKDSFCQSSSTEPYEVKPVHMEASVYYSPLLFCLL